nr:MAG TPA: hypothetical protein [Caudoviricetes sp.]
MNSKIQLPTETLRPLTRSGLRSSLSQRLRVSPGNNKFLA